MSLSKQDVLDRVDQENIKFVRLWFTDILGQLKGFTITRRELDDALDGGMGFDGSSIEGFSRIFESDLIAMPDVDTLAIMPFDVHGERYARLICDIRTPEGEPYEGDPRHVLRRNVRRAAEMGFTMYVGPELEYFYFRNDSSPEVLDRGGYFDMLTMSEGTQLRKKTVFALEKMGIQVEYSHHEVAPSQHEIDLRYQEALKMADTAMTYRLVVKEVAAQAGVYATFMPKPLFGVNGSGMHVHQSLFKGDRNAFFDPDDEYHLSGVAKSYIAGLLKHQKEIVAVTNQWVNSYKRLVPGYEAPAYIAWGQRNRSALVRVPRYKPGHEAATRIELRAPDPAANPYLAFAVMLAAGLKGVREGYELPPPVEQDIFEMSEAERRELNVETVPGSLIEAVQELSRSELVRDALGEYVFRKFVDNKLAEWDKYRTRVTDFEIDTYLPIL